MTQLYQYDGDGLVIEQYNDRVPFAGFLPGVAGARGRPAWVFYVNRGQAVASLGVRNKDGAFLEFHPADKAWQLTPARGFRTFVKIAGSADGAVWEPFRCGAGAGVRQRMYVTPHEVGVEEIDPRVELGIRADTFTLPEAAVAAVVRRVEIVNNAAEARTLQIVDGLPQVLPWGLNQWAVKFMSRTSEAFMGVEGVEERLPFYRLKVWPTDSPRVEPVVAGNFFAGFLDGKRNAVLVDPERLFGSAGDFSRPENFSARAGLDLARQVVANQTPAAFQVLELTLQPGERRVFHGLYGHAATHDVLLCFVAEAQAPGYFDTARDLNRRLIAGITRRVFTLTARPRFDAHVRQCYLDNGVRGGFPTEVPGGALLYLFGRKHGDLERDYNDFLLQDTPFSEGNGDFRDVLQNRRMDLFFAPALDARNIRYFFNLVQPDGYNPCALRNTRFAVHDPHAFAHTFGRFPALEAVLSREFKYAEMWEAIATAEDPEALAGDILAQAQEVEDAEFDRGYWSDHWTYLVDLLIQYAAVFPDRLGGLFTQRSYSFFDPTHHVAPRARKYVVTPAGVRQYGAVIWSEEKKALIDARPAHRYKVRAQAGRGDIVQTTLLGKILTLVANKLATLDPFGVGIEMEADRPGWCDALNGLPGIFGSSVNETIELKRLIEFTLRAMPAGDGELPAARGTGRFRGRPARAVASPRARALRVLAGSRSAEGKLPCCGVHGLLRRRGDAALRRRAGVSSRTSRPFSMSPSGEHVHRKASSRISPARSPRTSRPTPGWRSRVSASGRCRCFSKDSCTPCVSRRYRRRGNSTRRCAPRSSSTASWACTASTRRWARRRSSSEGSRRSITAGWRTVRSSCTCTTSGCWRWCAPA